MGRKPLGPWVVAGADGSAGGLAAVDLAAAEATMRGLRLRVVAACPPQDSDCAQSPGALAVQVEANRAVAEAAARAHLASPDLTVRTLVVAGDLVEALIRESHAAGVVVVGCGSRPGSVWAQVAAHARCPTILVPSNVDTAARGLDAPVVVGVAASGLDDAAIGFAFEEAAARGVPLLAASVTADRRVAETVSGWAEKYPRVPVERVSLYSANPTDALIQASGRAGLVVVGASVRAAPTGQLPGALNVALIERAGCPVCVVRHAGG